MDGLEKIKSAIVPDIIPEAPVEILRVTYANDLQVNCGNELTPKQVKDRPVSVKWNADSNALYTLIMTDPDAPAKHREVKHWMIVNIPGDDLEKGDEAAAYVGSGPPQGSGLHRYIFLIYKQKAKIDPGRQIGPKSIRGRPGFNTKAFVQKHQLSLVAGNFYNAQYDEYVDEMMRGWLGWMYPFYVCLRTLGIA